MGRGAGGLGSLPVLTLAHLGMRVTPGCAHRGEKDSQGDPHVSGYGSADSGSCRSHGADNRSCGWKAEIGKEGVLINIC